MKRSVIVLAAAALCWPSARAQEAQAGVSLRATFTGQLTASSIFTDPTVSEPPVSADYRSVLYPTVKFNDHWTATGAWQLYSRHFFYDTFSTAGYGAKGALLGATLNYSRVSGRGSFTVRAGQLATAFGAFPLHYDDADNPLVDVPPQYGYYYAPVSLLSLAGAQIDVTRGKFDGRVQFANSSPTNPRSLFAHDQYGNWAGGAGIAIRQGLRIGISGYRGPYLSRNYPFFFPGEANPNTLPAHAIGVDTQFAHGHWNLSGEFQRFTMPYAAIPTFHEDAGYVEVRRVLSPRWFVSSRAGYTSASFGGNTEHYEFAGAFRPSRLGLLKADYELAHHSQGSPTYDNTFALQFVTTLQFSHATK